MKKKVLVAPLDWGLGHATRCIPIINELLRQGHEVSIASDGGNVERLLKEEFPKLKFLHLKGYNIQYSKWLPVWLKVGLQLPKILYRAVAEHRQLKKIIYDHSIDVVISDNRFGLWNKNIKSIYITHQLMIKCPKGFQLLEPFLYRLHKSVINRYNACWVPDWEGAKNLSSDLSHKYPKPNNVKFIGSLSRFKEINSETPTEFDVCVILSGPEGARIKFQKTISKQLLSFSGKAVVVLGNPNANSESMLNGAKVFSHLNAKDLEKVISKSKLVACSAGYSGIMDLLALKKDAVLIPTPGQTEQEYLADNLHRKKIFRKVSLNEFDLTKLNGDKTFTVANFEFPSSHLLQEEIRILTL